MRKKVLIALPPAMLEQVDRVAEAEHRTRSDLVREALRAYIHMFATKEAALVKSTFWTKPVQNAEEL